MFAGRMARRLLKGEGMTINTAQTATKFNDEISYGDDQLAAGVPSTPEPSVVTDTVTGRDVGNAIKAPRARRQRNLGVKAGEVDAEGAARAKADEELAKLIGLAPRPPVYEIGSRVNEIGVKNFKASRQKWEEYPTLPELERVFCARIESEKRRDFLMPANALTATNDGTLSFSTRADVSDALLIATDDGARTLARPETDGNEAFEQHVAKISERALLGLASRVTPGGAKYLAQCPADLRAANLNHWLQKRGDTELTLRTRNTVDGTGRELYAACGPKYAAFDADKVMRKAAAAIGHDARAKITYDGYRMTLDAIFHTNVEPKRAVAGEFFKGMIRVRAADDGSGSVNVSLGLWRNLCLNLIIIDFSKVLVGKRSHIGADTIESDIAELMAVANERIGMVVGKWSEANAEEILGRYDLQDVDAVFRGLVMNHGVRATGIKPEEMITRLHRAWEREPGYSKASILNAITRAAHEEEWRSWSDAEELESTAGELLYQPVWNLDVSEKTAEQLLA
jgi:hypothetical protein